MSWGVGGSDELPPEMPSAMGRPMLWLRAISSASVRGGGGGGPPPVLRASAFFLLAIMEVKFEDNQKTQIWDLYV